MKDTIGPDTNLDLLQAAKRYAESVHVGAYMPVGRFATSYAGIEVSNPQTLVTGDQASLAISLEGDGLERTFLNIDLYVEGPTTIVRPGLYDAEGNHDPQNGSYARLVVRPLFEEEGCALVADLNDLATLIPEARRKLGLI